MPTTVILSAARTPIGAFMGALSSLSAPELGAIVIKAALERAGVEPAQVDEVIMGNVLTAGVGQAPARQAALKAGLPTTTPCMTINKVCGSGLKSVMLADQAIRCGDAQVIVAGGQESMSNAPYLLPKGRTGYRYGHGQVLDSMLLDGLTDAYEPEPMGVFADRCAAACAVSRAEQDEYAIESYRRALRAQEQGFFNDEIVPVPVKTGKSETIVTLDEEPQKVKFEKIPELKPVFTSTGTVTAANASSIDDGAAALVLASDQWARENGKTPLARIVAQATYAHNPADFNTAPIHSIERLLAKAGMTVADVDLFEINEAFAVTALVAKKQLGIPHDKLNVHGGAVALGHPIGASGARILTTLLYALRRYGKRYGVAALCIGGGEATAVLVEMLQ
ncbi:MAG: thiolase family protein [Bacteroidota bacterium]|nr:thiolase family protein [Candidatus Kapabacteria bacterium]MCX7936783.1 thiolase family protein [Chlorobiota bacterium]MDW8074173.1 thiolase family protein [Bacteroidota bacterium]MDW8271351.1 thiolase family protein [Bacteroidota bacterium]